MTSVVLILALGLFPAIGRQSAEKIAGTPAHVSTGFEFDVHAPLTEVAPLFGPEGERCWAGKHWNPAFVYPQPGKDAEGAVFTIAHGPHTVVWVNTIFDVADGRMQYVAVIPEVQTFTVDVRLNTVAAALTHVKVAYTRTALDAAANDAVIAMGKMDGSVGPDWQKAIESYLKDGSASACTQALK
jgi:hypothetical protein